MIYFHVLLMLLACLLLGLVLPFDLLDFLADFIVLGFMFCSCALFRLWISLLSYSISSRALIKSSYSNLINFDCKLYVFAQITLSAIYTLISCISKFNEQIWASLWLITSFFSLSISSIMLWLLSCSALISFWCWDFITLTSISNSSLIL